jgi:hypothetical protein
MNVNQLVEAIAAFDAKDALPCKLTLDEWKALAPYLSVNFLRVGEPLMREGDADRELFILADGELQVKRATPIANSSSWPTASCRCRSTAT